MLAGCLGFCVVLGCLVWGVLHLSKMRLSGKIVGEMTM